MRIEQHEDNKFECSQDPTTSLSPASDNLSPRTYLFTKFCFVYNSNILLISVFLDVNSEKRFHVFDQT